MKFFDDIRQQLAGELQQLGYVLPTGGGVARDDLHAVLMIHWNARLRRIPARRRRVRWSAELLAKIPQLTPAIQSGLLVTAHEITEGTDLTPRLSRQIARPGIPRRDSPDAMLNDWGLHHLHLGVSVLPSGIVPGANEILFALFPRDDAHMGDAYMIDVGTHHSWTDDNLVEIVHRNWPNTIARWRHDAVRLHHALSPSQRLNLRRKNGNAPVQMKDGTVYAAIGGGTTGVGSNIGAIRWADATVAEIERLDDLTRSPAWVDEVKRDVLAVTSVPLGHLDLRAEFRHDSYLVYVTNAATPYAVRVPM